ncbi:hypothetical protein ES708_30828 [subsurface metagenome]
MKDKNALTTAQVADILNVHVYTLYPLLNSGELKGFRLKTHWRVLRKDLDAYIEARKKAQGGLKT